MEHFTLKLDPETGDLVFDEAGRLATVSGDEATAQNVRITLDAWRGEFMLDETHGTDYARALGEDSYTVLDGEAEEVIRDGILQEPRVVVVTEIEAQVAAGRSLEASFQAELASGATITQEVNTSG